MTPPPKSRWRLLGKIFLLMALFSGLLAGGFLWYITTDSFRQMVSRRLVAQLERITGGKAEIGSVEISPFQLRVDLKDLTIHGLEKPGEAPYLHVEQLVAVLKLRSLFAGDLGFRSIVIDHPALHLEIYPDGSTNQPSPTMAAESSSQGLNQLQQLFSLSVNRIDIRHGTLVWGNRQVPLDFSLEDLSADTDYSFLHRRYEANVLLGRAEVRFEGLQPVALTAEIHLSAEHNRIELKSLKAGSSGAHLEASGSLQNFLQPQVEGKYAGDLDLARAASVVRNRQLRSGTLQYSGEGSWSEKTFSAKGRFSTNDLAWRDSNFNLNKASFTGKFSAGPTQLGFSQVQGRLFGGKTTGEVMVTNWLPGAPVGKSRKNAQQDGTIHLRLTNLSVADIAESVSNANRPLDRIGVEGVTNGTIDTHWTGSPRNAEVKIAVDVAAPAGVTHGRLPLDAHARLIYYGAQDQLRVEQLDANTQFTQIHASGELSQRASLRLSATTADLDELAPVVVALGGPRKLPFTLDGKAAFNGTVSGKLSSPSLSGTVQASDFEVMVPATSRTPERKIHGDDLKADVQYSPKSLVIRSARVRHDATQLSFDLDLGLQKGIPQPGSSVSGHMEAHRADLAEVLSLAGYHYPVGGTVDLEADLSGTKSSPKVRGHAEASNASAYGIDIQKANTQLEWDGNQVSLHDISIAQVEQKVTGAASYNFASGAFQFDLSGRELDLQNLQKFSGRNLAVQGRSDFHATGAGTRQQPSINANVNLRSVSLNGQDLGNSTFQATTQGSDLHLTGHSQYQQAQMTTDGTIHLRNDWPCNIKLHFTQVNADPLLRVYMKGRVNSHSLIDGDLLIQGPLLKPRELRINGDFANVTLGVGDVNIHNDAPVRFVIADQLLTIEPFHFTGERTDLTGDGTVQLAGDRKLNLRTHGRVSLRLLESINPDFTSAGVVTVDLNIAGTVSNPAAQGRFEIRNGSVAYIDLPNALSSINGTLVFNQDRIQIETLTAQTGGGTMQFQGYATAHNGQFNFDVNVHGDDVRLRYPPGISSTATTDLRFAGNNTSSLLSGDVTITRLSMSQNFDFASYLATSSRTATLSQTNPLLNSIHLNVHIVTTPELQMQTTMLRLSGNADVQLRGTAAKPVLLGRADITEGEIYFNGTKYHLERGEVSFRDPSGIQPYLDLQMTTRVRDYDITVSLNGPPDRLKLQYRSEPPLPEADIVSLLALGRTREESAQQQGNSVLGQEASNAILTQALNATVSSRVQNLFGGSRIKIDPQGLTTETTAAHGPQVTIEQQVTDKLTLTYSTNVSQSSQQIIQMEYNVSRNLSVLAVRDQNGVVSFDVSIRQRKK